MSMSVELEPFSYYDVARNTRLLDIDDLGVNLLRQRLSKEPITCARIASLDDFLEEYADYAGGFGLAFRGQPFRADWLLNSSFVRHASSLPCLKLDDFNYYRHGLDIISTNCAGRDMLGPISPDMFLLMSQHYQGVSTYLDWTLNIWTALYFAFAGTNTDDSDCVAIYMADIGKMHHLSYAEYRRGAEKRSEPVSPDILYTLSQITPERECSWLFMSYAGFVDIRQYVQDAIVARQRSHGYRPVCLESYVDPSTTLTENYGYQPAAAGTLHVVVMPYSEKDAVLDYLSREHNIRESTIFPDMAELMRAIWNSYRE